MVQWAKCSRQTIGHMGCWESGSAITNACLRSTYEHSLNGGQNGPILASNFLREPKTSTNTLTSTEEPFKTEGTWMSSQIQKIRKVFFFPYILGKWVEPCKSLFCPWASRTLLLVYSRDTNPEENSPRASERKQWLSQTRWLVGVKKNKKKHIAPVVSRKKNSAP